MRVHSLDHSNFCTFDLQSRTEGRDRVMTNLLLAGLSLCSFRIPLTSTFRAGRAAPH